VSRGFLEAEIAVSPTYSFTLITAHLKSKRPIPRADEAELRLEEAKLLRERIDSLFAQNESLNLIVLGDLNDNKDAPPMREIIGRGKHKLVDTRPAEPNPEDKGQTARNITWTHFYSVEDTYSRLDYILLSSGMAREWKIQETYILKVPDWGLASDHRPLLATFEAEDK
jgi:endonuclease/exonuclease/phosphatase family metal-dependent hydrolase